MNRFIRGVCIVLFALSSSAVFAADSGAGSADWAAIASKFTDVRVDPAFQVYQKSVCQYHGFSFEDEKAEMEEMKKLGANSVMTNVMWIPQEDPSAPNGDGYDDAYLQGQIWTDLKDVGISCAVAVGDWNNGIFPYYPEPFYKKYPDFTMLDQNKKPFQESAFKDKRGWPSIDHPQQIEGAKRFTRAFCAAHKTDPTISMWLLGGEALYPTYCFNDRWSDYSGNSISHFRAWLRERHASIDKLNKAWGENFDSFDDVQPPKKIGLDIPSRDWLDFRYRAMAERFAWLYQSVISGDESRLALSCNHGDIYHDQAAAEMGAMPDIYASVSDGFETGQILNGDDPGFFNLLYAESLSGLGEPIAPTRLAYQSPPPPGEKLTRSYTPEAVRRFSYETLGTGQWLLGLIQWRGFLPDGVWGMKGTPAVDEAKKVFSEIQSLTPMLEHMYSVRPSVGVYLSRSTWSLIGFSKSWKELHAGLIRHQIQKDYIYDTSDFSRYKVIISVNNEIVDANVAQKLRQFVNNGGTLIISGKFFVKDEGLQPRPPIFPNQSAKTLFPGAALQKIGKGKIIALDEAKNAQDLINKIAGTLRTLKILQPTAVSVVGTPDAARNIEAFTLTDGLNVLQVFVNLANTETKLTASIDPNILPEDASRYDVSLRQPEQSGFNRSSDTTYQLSLQPHGTAAVAWTRKTTESEAASAITAAENRINKLGKAVTPYSTEYLASAKAAITRRDYPKAAAFAARAAASLGIRTEFFRQDRDKYLRVSILDADGEITDAELEVSIKPGFEKSRRIMRAENGAFVVPFAASDLPRVYNYREHKYETLSEPFTVYLTARRGGEIGTTRIVVGQKTD